MFCKSLIYAANTASSSVVSGATLPLTTIVRRRGCDLNLSGNAIAITDTGSNYYMVTVNATFTAPVAGDVTLVLQQNGVNVTGATASTTITTPTTEVRSLSFQTMVRTFNNQGLDNLTIVDTGVGAVFTNIAITVEKI